MRRSDAADGDCLACGQDFHQLSGGNVSAWCWRPHWLGSDVLLLDEPTVYLDLKQSIQFYSIVEKLNSERGMTIIGVTHDVNLAGRYARRMMRFAMECSPPTVAEQVLTARKFWYDIFEIHRICRQASRWLRLLIVPPGKRALSTTRFLTVIGSCVVILMLVILTAPWIGSNAYLGSRGDCRAYRRSRNFLDCPYAACGVRRDHGRALALRVSSFKLSAKTNSRIHSHWAYRRQFLGAVIAIWLGL